MPAQRKCLLRGHAPQAHSFLSCQKRMGRKEALERFIALTRLKAVSFRFTFCRYTVRRQNALRAAHSSMFTGMSRRGKYLTYESRKSSGFAGDGSKVRGFAPSLVVLRGLAKGENRNSPFAILSFDRQRRFLSHVGKKAGLICLSVGIFLMREIKRSSRKFKCPDSRRILRFPR